MNRKTSEIVCVSCRMPYVYDSAKSKNIIPASSTSSSKVAPSAAAVAVPARTVQDLDIAQIEVLAAGGDKVAMKILQDYNQAMRSSHQQPQQQPPPPPPKPAQLRGTPVPSSSSSSSSSPTATIAAATSVLYTKLHETTQRLQGSSLVLPFSP